MNFEILSECGLYVELSNKTTTCVFSVFQEQRNRVGVEGNGRAQTRNYIVFASRGRKSGYWTKGKTGKAERREKAQKRDPRQRAYCEDALSGSLCFELAKGGRKSSVFNGFWPPRGAPGRPRGRGIRVRYECILFSCRGERRGRERGGNAFLQYPLTFSYDFGGPRESVLKAF